MKPSSLYLNIRIANPHPHHPSQWTGPEKRTAIDLIDSWLQQSFSEPIRFRDHPQQLLSETSLSLLLQKECSYQEDYVSWTLRPNFLTMEQFLKDHYQKNNPQEPLWRKILPWIGLIPKKPTEKEYLQHHLPVFALWVLQSVHLRTELIKFQSNLKGLLQHWNAQQPIFVPLTPPSLD